MLMAMGLFETNMMFLLPAAVGTFILVNLICACIALAVGFAAGVWFFGAKLATGSVPVELRTPTDFTVRFNQSVAAEARVVVRGLLLLSAEGELGRDGLAAGGSSEYRAARVGIGVRY